MYANYGFGNCTQQLQSHKNCKLKWKKITLRLPCFSGIYLSTRQENKVKNKLSEAWGVSGTSYDNKWSNCLWDVISENQWVVTISFKKIAAFNIKFSYLPNDQIPALKKITENFVNASNESMIKPQEPGLKTH